MVFNKLRNSKTGFTLIEIAIGLAILAVLFLAVLPASGMRETARVNSMASTIRTLRNAAESYIADGNRTYTGVNVAVLKTAKHLPTGFTTTGSNPWGGNYAVAPNASNSSKVNITATAVPTSAGPKLVALFTNQADSAAYNTTSKTLTLTY